MAYKNNLAHKNLMFITLRDNAAAYFEVIFLPANFLHLTGVQTNHNGLDFYNLAVKDRLSERDFSIKPGGITDLKLDILPSLMNIHLSARMVGDYDHSQTLLVTDKLAGTTTAAMGFRKMEKDNTYIPNTALNTDMRDISEKPIHKIAAILIKGKNELKYSKPTYIAKGVSLDDDSLKQIISEKVCIQEPPQPKA